MPRVALLLLFGLFSARAPAATETMVRTNGVDLHAIDYGGRGQLVVLLAGMNDSAHVWDDFAPRFTARYHVVALTRRGHGASGKPATGYDTATLIDDVRGALDAWGAARAILVGHSFAGDELTAFAGRYPDRLAALVYLDAAYDRARLPSLVEADPAGEPSPAPADLASFAAFERWYRGALGFWSPALAANLRATYAGPDGTVRPALPGAAGKALYDGMVAFRPDYAAVRVPALAIYAIQQKPALPPAADAALRKKAQAYVDTVYAPWQREQADRFAREAPCATVTLLPGADHYLFIDRADAVADAVATFLAAPPACVTARR